MSLQFAWTNDDGDDGYFHDDVGAFWLEKQMTMHSNMGGKHL